MNKLFLIVISADMPLDRDKIIASLVEKKQISFWFYCLPYSFFVRSNLTARQLQDSIMGADVIHRIFIIHIAQGADLSGLIPDNQVPLFKNL
jgi:hypothetical protein